MSENNRRQANGDPCLEFRGCVEDWLDDMLDGASRARLDAHLSECDGCREFFSRRGALAGDLLTLGRAADALAGSAMPKSSPRIIRWRSWSVAAATILFFLTAGLYVHEFGRNRSLPDEGEPRAAQSEEQLTHSGPLPEPGSAAGRDFDMTCPEGRLMVPMASSNPRIHIVWLYDQTVFHETPADAEPSQQPASPG